MVRGASPRNTNTAATKLSLESDCELRTAEVHGKGGDRRGAREDAGEPLGMPQLRSHGSVGFRRRDSPAEPLRHRGCHDVPLSAGDRQLTIEQVDEGGKSRDNRDIRHALLTIDRESSLSYAHEDPDGKPMSWVADAVAWCSGAGGT